MPQGVIEKAKNKDTEALVDGFAYALMLLGCFVDIFITSNVIMINEIAAFNAVEVSKIILSLAGIKIVTELDNWYASWYIPFMVDTTVDGFEMTRP